MVKAHYDPECLVASVTFAEGRIDHTRECEGGVLVDVDKDGRPLAIELLNLTRDGQPPRLAKVATAEGFSEHLDDIYAALASVRSWRTTGPLKLGLCRYRTG